MVALRDENSIPDRNCVMDLNSIDIRISEAIDNQIKLNINHNGSNQSFLEEVSKIEDEHQLLNLEFDRIGHQLDNLLASLAHESFSSNDVIVIDEEEADSEGKQPSAAESIAPAEISVIADEVKATADEAVSQQPKTTSSTNKQNEKEILKDTPQTVDPQSSKSNSDRSHPPPILAENKKHPPPTVQTGSNIAVTTSITSINNTAVPVQTLVSKDVVAVDQNKSLQSYSATSTTTSASAVVTVTTVANSSQLSKVTDNQAEDTVDDADIHLLGIVDESSNEESDDDTNREILPGAGLASPNSTPIKENNRVLIPFKQITIPKTPANVIPPAISVAGTITLKNVVNTHVEKAKECGGLSSPDSSNSSGDDDLLQTTMHITPKKNQSPTIVKEIKETDSVVTEVSNSKKMEDKTSTKCQLHPTDIATEKKTAGKEPLDVVMKKEAVTSQPKVPLASRKSGRVSALSTPTSSSDSKDQTPKPLKDDVKPLKPLEKRAKLLQTIHSSMRDQFEFVPNMKVLCKAEKGDIWVDGIIVAQVTKKDRKIRYKIKLSQPPFDHKIFLENLIAPRFSPRRGTLYVGSRVIAERPYETIDTDRAPKIKGQAAAEVKEVLYGGIVAEMSCEANSYRYLIIFDDGFAQYVMKRKMFQVPFPATNVWNDLPGNMQMFMKEYLEEYPMRPMLKVEAEQTIVTEWNGNWLKAKVLAVDASLVKVLFQVDNRTELIYRGSSRLEPLMNELDRRDMELAMSKAKRKKLKISDDPTKWESDILDLEITRYSFGVSPYSTTDPDGEQQLRYWQETRPKSTSIMFADKTDAPLEIKKEKEKSRHSSVESDRPLKRSVESKEVIHHSTPSPSPSSSSSCSLEVAVTAANQLSALMLEKSDSIATSSPDATATGSPSDKSHRSRMRLARRSCSIDEFKEKTNEDIANDRKLAGSHECASQCSVKLFKSQKDKAKHNHLAIPMLLGWSRESVKRKPGYHRDVYYRAPCKRRLRNIEEVARYLVETNTKNVSINQFCFDSNISCRDHNSSFQDAKVFIPDLSGGLERVPVQCVNEIDDSKPPQVIYSSSRLPSQGVTINTDPGFLSCCSCTNDCLDKTKCECAQLALDGARIISNMKEDDTIGYQYRRLFGCVPTGLYECNENCSCSSGCFNRVIQNGISLRLQIFMTESKGWGLRCLDDVPEGAFICTYAGHILNEEMANREGTDFGDEYLAELDHIESVEIGKEGYEATVPELSKESPKNSGSSSPVPAKRMRMNGSEDSGDDKPMTQDLEAASEKLESAVIDLTDDVNDTNDTSMDSQPKRIVLPKSSSLRLMIDKLKSQVKVDALPVKRKLPADPTNPESTSVQPSNPQSTSVEFSNPQSALTESGNLQSSQIEAANPQSTSGEISMNEDVPSAKSELASRPIMLTERVKQMIKDSRNTRALACKSTSPITAVTKLFSSPRSSTGSFIRRRMPPTSVAPVVVIPDDPDSADNSKTSPGERKTSRRFFDEDYCYVIDAKSVGNAGRYINHSCSPNLFVQNIFVDTHDLRFPWVAFFAQRNIPSLTELTWDYSYDVGSVRDKIIKCNCGSIDCRGRLL